VEQGTSSKRVRRGPHLVLLVVGILIGSLLLTPVFAAVTNYYTKAQSDKRFRSVWALVRADGTIAAQSGGISVTLGNPDGRYYVHFKTRLSGQPILVTPKYSSDNDNAVRAAKAVPCGGPGAVPGGVTCVIAGTNNAKTAYVEVLDSTDTTVNTAFYIVLPPAR